MPYRLDPNDARCIEQQGQDGAWSRFKCHGTVPDARKHLAALAMNIEHRAPFEIAKLDAERRIVFGWAYTAELGGKPVVDHSGDFIDKDALGDLENAVYAFNLDSRAADENHERFEGVGRLVESVIFTPEKLQKMGLPENARLGWWTGFKIDDMAVWAKVKSGELGALSIRGVGDREPAALAA